MSIAARPAWRVLQAALALAGAVFVASAAYAENRPKLYVFGREAEVVLPAGYDKAPDSGEILRAVSSDGAAVRFSLELRDAGKGRNAGEALVRNLAKKSGLAVHRSGKKLVLLEPHTTGQLDGRATRSTRLHIGFGRSVVLMSLTVPEDAKDSHRVQRFFDVDMEQIIESIRRTHG